MNRAQAWDAEQRTFRRQEPQTLQTIAEELRRVRKPSKRGEISYDTRRGGV